MGVYKAFTLDTAQYKLWAYARTRSKDNQLYYSDPSTTTMTPSSYINQNTIYATSTCTSDWIEIEGSSSNCKAEGNLGQLYFNRYCGRSFQTKIMNFEDTLKYEEICDCTPPFTVGVYTDNA